MSAEKYTIGLIQMQMAVSPQENLERASDHVLDAARRGAQIICLPELFRSQYFCQREDVKNFDLAETIPGPSTEALSKIARHQRVTIIASLFEKRAPGLF